MLLIVLVCLCSLSIVYAESGVLVATGVLQPVVDGELNSFTPSVGYAQYVSGQGLDQTGALALQPDNWHAPSVIFSAPLWRADFTQYSAIEMSIRCSVQAPLNMHFNRWVASGTGGNSATVDLSAYVTPPLPSGVNYFDTTWSKVVVPISAFYTAGWQPLSGVERIYFNSDSQNRVCYVDNMYLSKISAKPTSPPTASPSTRAPTASVSKAPTPSPPTRLPSATPSLNPSATPSLSPTAYPTRIAAVVTDSVLRSDISTFPVFDGETNSYIPTSVAYSSIVDTTGVLNSAGLQLQPDPWHAPGILLSAPAYRSNLLTSFDELVLYAKCATEGVPLSIHFAKWTPTGTGGTSSSVFLGDFVVPADNVKTSTIGTVWTYVRIPLTAFLSNDWDLSGAEWIYFNSDSQSRVCFVDNVYFFKKIVPTFSPTSAPSFSPTPAPSAMPTTSAPTRAAIVFHENDLKLRRVLGVLPLYDGETGSFVPTDIRYAQSLPGVGIEGSTGLKLLPDAWHAPTFLLLPPAYRSDILLYNELILHARCESAGVPLSVHFGKWTSTGTGGTSASVFLGNYAEPRDIPVASTIGTEWTFVRIPIKQFVSPSWDLAGAEWLYFNSDASNRICYIDNVYMRENKGPIVTDVSLITDSVVKIQFNKYFELISARTLGNYIALQNSANPASVGLSYRFREFASSSFVPRSDYYVHVSFAQPFVCNGADTGVDLVLDNITDPALNKMNRTVIRVPCMSKATTAIKVNQLGYLPNRPKLAYVGDYYGDMGGGVWVVGAMGSIWTWNRAQNSFVKLNNLPSIVATYDLYDVAVNSEFDVWVVGQRGLILHFDGLVWSIVASSTTQHLRAIDFGPTRRGVIVGDNGVILTFLPTTDGLSSGSWVADTTSSISSSLRCVWVGDDTIWIGGVSGTIASKNLLVTNGAWVVKTPITSETILSFEGVRTDGVYAALATNGVLLRNQWGSWILDTPLDPSVQAFALNPTFLQSGVALGRGGAGYVITSPTATAISSSSTGDFTTVALLDERTIFGFGIDGVCMMGSTVDISSPWRACNLPGAASVYGSAALMEGPLRIPFPRPSVYLENQDSTGQWSTVGTYALKLEAMNYRLSGEDLFSVDFTSTQSTGVHRLRIPGIGYSLSFQIDKQALRDAADNTCKILYYQRSGTPLVEPYAEPEFVRGIDHEFNTNPGGRRIDAAYHWSIAQSPLYDNETVCQLHSVCPEESLADGSGGWFDAGDYSKYVSTGTAAVWRLMTLVDILSQRGINQRDDFNIPESGDGIPDALNEATWEIKWMLKMQKADGGVFNKVASEIWESGMPQTSDLGGEPVRFFMERTTHDTATVGAVFALASRLWVTYDSQFAAQLLNRALLAWSFLESHPVATPSTGFVNPPGHISGPYPDVDDSDNRAWLSAELYRTTCDVKYGQRYVDYIVSKGNVVNMLGNDFTDYGLEAAWAFYYSSSCASSVSEAASFAFVRGLVYSRIRAAATGTQGRTLSNPYRSAGRLDVPVWIGWGSFGLNWGNIIGVLGWHMLDDESHLDWLSLSMDTTLGANPLSMSFTSGVGQNTPQDPLQGQSRSDGIDRPIPGYGVFGPFCHITFASPAFAIAQGDSSNYPSLQQPTSPYPILRRWSDSNLLPQYNEGGVGPATFQCMVYQTLAATAKDSVSTASTIPPVPTNKPTAVPKVAMQRRLAVDSWASVLDFPKQIVAYFLSVIGY